MNTEDRARELFERALARHPSERERWVRDSGVPREVVSRVLELLAHHDRTDDFLVSVPPAEASSQNIDAAVANPDQLPFERLDEFILVREIGRGGMGVVYLAKDTKLDRLVALKILSSISALSSVGRERFHNEAVITARLSHPSIVPIYQQGADQGVFYIASEFIEGEDLANLIERRKTEKQLWKPRDAALLLAPIADALHHAHQKNIIHRDVKPSNILLDERSRSYLTDFGLAKMLDEQGLTRTGEIAGTFFYMSPEQVLAHRVDIDHRTDVFSLGVVLYELVSGNRPFQGESREEVLRAISFATPTSLRQLSAGLPRDLEVICERALEKSPEDRFSTAADLAADLRRFAEGDVIHARPASLWRRLRRWARRSRQRILLVVSIVVFLWIGLVLGRQFGLDGRINVAFSSDPSGTTVTARPLILDTGEYGDPITLGTTPCDESLAAGHYRFTFESNEGFAEAVRKIGSSTDSVGAEIRHTEPVVSDMALVSGGAFFFGIPSPDTDFGERDSDYRSVVPGPSRFGPARVDSFYIDRCEVTNAEYRQFVEETQRPAPPFWRAGYDSEWDDLPVVGVTWIDARDYAEWIGKRLPTRLEWERAGRGTDGSSYPWPDSLATDVAVSELACVARVPVEDLSIEMAFQQYLESVVPVGSMATDCSSDGVFDLLGNVCEWLETPQIIETEQGGYADVDRSRCVLGGAWRIPVEAANLWSIVSAPENKHIARAHIGFRCAKSCRP